jgi:hypothetical protein
MKGNDAMSQANRYCVKDRNIVWKGTIEEFCHLVEDATNWRLYQAEQKQRWTLYQEQKRGARVEEPEYLRDTELLP